MILPDVEKTNEINKDLLVTIILKDLSSKNVFMNFAKEYYKNKLIHWQYNAFGDILIRIFNVEGRR